MILIGLGGNLPSHFGPPLETCEAALEALRAAGVSVVRRSRWWRTAPVPVSGQPWFVNGVAAVETDLKAWDLLAVLHRIEAEFGRVRGARDAARVIDIDLLAYGDAVIHEGGLDVPHPRLHARAFVLLPLAEVAPGWRHPESGEGVDAMIARLPPEQTAVPVPR